jgi:ribosome biogenesis GTPase
VIVITKSDLAGPLDASFPGAPVIVTSSITGEGVDAIAQELRPPRTGVFLGPSGVGKSTLINRIGGEEVMGTREVHASSGEGRHMTSHRQLIQLPEGGMIIDTPGLREAQLWDGEQALGIVFEDIEELALECRFSDCRHLTEPGCAIKEAIAAGRLDRGRFESYRKLQRELRSIAARSDARLQADERRKWKQIAVANRARERYLR